MTDIFLLAQDSFIDFAAVYLSFLLEMLNEPFVFRSILPENWVLMAALIQPTFAPRIFFCSVYAYEHLTVIWIGSRVALIFPVWFDVSDFLSSQFKLFPDFFFFFFSSDRVKVSSWYCFSLKLVSLIGTCWQPYLSRVLPIFPLIIMTTARPGVSMFNPSDLDKFRQKPFWKIKGCNSSDISNAMIRILNNALYIYY